ncbi:AN1-type zinc finger domain-containing protein [Natrarchaeobius oligotrophus]|uniref:AN1-type domain-containing protein n=1 Tax=Natrarchaeobius chitinivorans TaxID=1679083 RepID=A0A3N6N091_NATCH|nr:hypothetical protein EA472_09525 [Natrarchaeobius chitinivorans]
MGECEYPGCSGDGTIQNSCSYCEFDYCSTHRLPERHNCPALSNASTLGPDFRTEFAVTTATPDEKTLCSDCQAAPVVFGEEFCEDCLRQLTGSRENKQCERCSNYTTPERDRCLDCRRRERVMDSKSPDVAPDGSLVTESVDPEDGTSQKSTGLISLLKSVFRRG